MASVAGINGRFTILFATPILAGKSEEWRRLLQEIIELHRPQYEESRQQLGITNEQVWIAEVGKEQLAIIAVVATHPEQIFTRLAASTLPFDRWYKDKLLALQGFDLTKAVNKVSPKLLLEWPDSQPPPCD